MAPRKPVVARPGGDSALHNAVLSDDPDAVAALLDAGVPVDSRDRQDRTALWLAASRTDVEIVRRLLSAGADPNATALGQSALLHAEQAALHGPVPDIVALLRAAGAEPRTMVDVHHRDRGGRTALHDACSHDRPELVTELLLSGADVGAVDTERRTALHCAAGSSTDTVLLILGAGADLEPQNRYGNTPLWEAMFSAHPDHEDVVRLLLEAGANPDAVNHAGKTPHDLANLMINPAYKAAFAAHRAVCSTNTQLTPPQGATTNAREINNSWE